MKHLFLLSFALFVIVSSCNQDDPGPDLTPGEDFISINTDMGDFQFKDDLGIFNSYILGPNQDQLSLVMKDENNLSCQIFISSSQLLEQSFPLEIPGQIGYGEVQIRDLTQDVDVTFGPEDDVNFVGTTFENVVFTITDFRDGYLTGTLSGTVSTPTGRQIIINSGEFGITISIEEGA